MTTWDKYHLETENSRFESLERHSYIISEHQRIYKYGLVPEYDYKAAYDRMKQDEVKVMLPKKETAKVIDELIYQGENEIADRLLKQYVHQQ